MQPTEASRLSDRQFNAGLQSEDALVLGAVILKNPLNFAPAANRPQIEDQQHRPYPTCQQIKFQRVFLQTEKLGDGQG